MTKELMQDYDEFPILERARESVHALSRDEWVLLATHEHYAFRANVADLCTDASVLDLLADDQHRIVQITLVENPNIAPERLEQLVRGSSDPRVIYAGLANSVLGAESYARLAESGRTSVVEALGSCRRAPEEVIRRVATMTSGDWLSSSAAERELARRRLLVCPTSEIVETLSSIRVKGIDYEFIDILQSRDGVPESAWEIVVEWFRDGPWGCKDPRLLAALAMNPKANLPAFAYDLLGNVPSASWHREDVDKALAMRKG